MGVVVIVRVLIKVLIVAVSASSWSKLVAASSRTVVIQLMVAVNLNTVARCYSIGFFPDSS